MAKPWEPQTNQVGWWRTATHIRKVNEAWEQRAETRYRSEAFWGKIIFAGWCGVVVAAIFMLWEMAYYMEMFAHAAVRR